MVPSPLRQCVLSQHLALPALTPPSPSPPLQFYLEEHPELLVDLLNVLQSRLDHARVVEMFRRTGHLPLVKDYLIAVQKTNILEVGGGGGRAEDKHTRGVWGGGGYTR